MISKARPNLEEMKRRKKERENRERGPSKKRAQRPKAPNAGFNRKKSGKNSNYMPGRALDSEIRIEGPNADSDA
jgi:hypothetical protein|tara:strand:- start:3926 stop:4147 length:222 start_codon:yes stop_codon:yes gene_type:complete